MKPIREIISGETPLGIACFDQRKPRFDHEYHHHPEIEITSIRSSDGQYLIGDATGGFRAGDLFVLGSNLPHRFKNWRDGLARSRVIQFRDDAFGDELFERAAFADIRRLFARATRGLLLRGAPAERASRRIDRVFRHRTRPGGLAELLLLLESLSEIPEMKPLCGPGYAPALDNTSEQRLANVLAHIDAHWHEPRV